MNGNYYQNPTFPSNPVNHTNNQSYSSNENNDVYEKKPHNSGLPAIEVSYIENILRGNKGKTVRAFFSYPDSDNSKDVEYFGTIEEAGIDHLIIKDSSNGSFYLLRMIYLNYFEFLEPINYRNNN
ncbi:MAG: spore coat protein GerQ [bacterium]